MRLKGISSLIASAKALTLGNPQHALYTSQQQCDQLPSTQQYHYEFVLEACACFVVLDNFIPFCDRDKPVTNPFLDITDL